MARIRTIKPEILEDEKTAGLSDSAFRLFLAMIFLADDHGNLRTDDRWLGGQVWWARGNPPRVSECLREVAEADLIVVYQVRDQVYAHIRSWDKHQRIDNRGKARVPLPSEGSPILAEFLRGNSRKSAGPRPPITEEDHDQSGAPDVAAVLIPVDAAQELAKVAVAEINRLARKKYQADSESVMKLCRALDKQRRTADQVIRVIRSKAPWIGDPKMGKFFRPATLLAAENFGNYLDDIDAETPRLVLVASNTNTTAEDDDEPDLTYAGFGT